MRLSAKIRTRNQPVAWLTVELFQKQQVLLSSLNRFPMILESQDCTMIKIVRHITCNQSHHENAVEHSGGCGGPLVGERLR
jgi:hypothetical protein